MKFEDLAPENFTWLLLNRKKDLESIIQKTQLQLKNAPEGRLYTSTSNKNNQFYLSITKPQTNNKITKQLRSTSYIRKTDSLIIGALAQKEYDNKILNRLQKELNKINSLVNLVKKNNIETVFSKIHPKKQPLIKTITLSNDNYAKKWLAVKFQAKNFDNNPNRYESSSGDKVRSKSEFIIAEFLDKFKIPFRYEYPIQLNNFTVYPDFYCLNLKTRQEFIWEHFGMMGDADYACKAIAKINAYMEKGFFPGKNLIVTAETLQTPINPNLIKSIIENYLA